jgi:hypothetical protein
MSLINLRCVGTPTTLLSQQYLDAITQSNPLFRNTCLEVKKYCTVKPVKTPIELAITTLINNSLALETITSMTVTNILIAR